MWSKIMLNPKKDNLENGFLKPEYPFKLNFKMQHNSILTNIVEKYNCAMNCVISRHVRILTFSDSQFTMIHLTDTGFNSLMIHLLIKFSKIQLLIHFVGKSILKTRFWILTVVRDAFRDSTLRFSVA